MAEYSIQPGIRFSSSIVVSGDYGYMFESATPNQIDHDQTYNLRCEKTHCPGRACIKDGVLEQALKRNFHTCNSQWWEWRICALRAKIRDRAKAEATSARVIINEALMGEHNLVLQNFKRKATVQLINRARQELIPTNPATLEAMIEKFESMDYPAIFQQLYQGCVTINDKRGNAFK